MTDVSRRFFREKTVHNGQEVQAFIDSLPEIGGPIRKVWRAADN
jgi:hypothetical protein